jgi:1-acyl-sn-glycerol-3-phosphate acyltransferase
LRKKWKVWLVALAFTVFIPWAMVRLAPYLEPHVPDTPFEMPREIVGLAMALLGAYVAFRAVMVLSFSGKGWPGDEPEHLVDTQIYRFVLHPMYWGYTVFWGGVAIHRGSVGLLAETAILGIAFTLWCILVEEPRLRRRFGAKYENHRRRTPTLLPVWRALYWDVHDMPNTTLILMAFFRGLSRILWNVQVEGEEHIPHEGPVMVVCNHVNLVDPFLVGSYFTRPIYFVASDELFRHPLTRWFFRCFKAMPKRRWSRDIASIREMRRRLDAGSAVGIFPEGQRNWDGGPVIVGDEVYRLLRHMGVPVLCVTLVGGHEAWPRWSKLPGICDMTVRFFEPIDPGDYRDVADFRHAVEARIFNFATEPPVPRRALALHKGITTVIWGCIECGGAMTLEETARGLRCSKCGAEWDVTAGLELVNCSTGARMLQRAYHSKLIRLLREGRMDGAIDCVFSIECETRAFRIESTAGLAGLGRGTLTLTGKELTFRSERSTHTALLGDIAFTYLNLANHLVVVGPEGALQFKIIGDSPVRWEDYLSAARGTSARQWKPTGLAAVKAERKRQA